MGCDIHVKIECRRKQDGKWVWRDYTPMYQRPKLTKDDDLSEYEDYFIGGRCYDAFALLAGVRNYNGIVPISEPKGIPDDMSESVQREYETWGKECHSHSYYTLMELEYYCAMHNVVAREWQDDEEILPTKELLRPYLLALNFVHEHIWTVDKNAIRMVFWFDN